MTYEEVVVSDFLNTADKGGPVTKCTSVQEGLAQKGWFEVLTTRMNRDSTQGLSRESSGSSRSSRSSSETTGHPVIPRPFLLGAGSFGVVQLVYKRTDQRVPIEAKHLAAVKLLTMEVLPEDLESAWTEIKVIQRSAHQNIVGHYGLFAVGGSEGGKFIPSQVGMILEFADAGDMRKEVCRFKQPPNTVPEPVMRYYSLQIARGLDFLHSIDVQHNDLSLSNVVLKYNDDGSKKAMIADFGSSRLLKANDPRRACLFQDDVVRLTQMIVMMHFYYSWMDITKDQLAGVSHEFRELILAWNPDAGSEEFIVEIKRNMETFPKTVTELLQRFSWFSLEAQAGFPEPPQHLLTKQELDQMGYDPPPTPAPGWSPQEIAQRLHSSATGTSHQSRSPSPQRLSPKTSGQDAGGQWSSSRSPTKSPRQTSDAGRLSPTPQRLSLRTAAAAGNGQASVRERSWTGSGRGSKPRERVSTPPAKCSGRGRRHSQ